jgi:serine/threonine protein kinase
MSTYTSEPGTRIAGRYRLVEQVFAGNGWTRWKAMDETLARPVSVLTFAQGFPRVSQVVTAARAASRLTDPRMAQVFDVEDGGGQAYIVLEWVGGETLTDMLSDGPLEPGRACSLISDATRALVGAHALGQAHLRLIPDVLCWTRSSGIKITGLGIDAALAGDGLNGPAAHDPAVADTIALAALLYAALTGYWPGEQPTALPAAPLSEGGLVCTPRQVSADVSSAIDSVVTRALLQRPTRQGPPISTPAAFAEALGGVAPPVPLPEPAPAPQVQAGYSDRGYRGYPNDPNNPDTWAVNSQGPAGTSPYPQRNAPSNGQGGSQYTPAPYQATGRGGTSRVMIVVVVVLVLAVIGATVWAVGLRKSPGSAAGATGTSKSPTTSQSATPAGTVLTPTGISTFNILGTDTEDASQAPNAIDGKTSTFWGTDAYQPPANFGNLKKGTGLLIDMGHAVKLSQVEVMVGTICCTTAEIYLGNNNQNSTTALQNFTLVGKSATSTASDRTLTYSVNSKATGRYVLVWLTGNLPADPDQSGQYQGRIYNVALRGSDASGTS